MNRVENTSNGLLTVTAITDSELRFVDTGYRCAWKARSGLPEGWITFQRKP